MRSSHLRSLAACTLAALSLPSFSTAQPLPDLPHYFVWSDGIPCGYQPAPHDFLKHIVWLYLSTPVYDSSGAMNADYAVDYILAHTRPAAWGTSQDCYGTQIRQPDLDPSTICIGFAQFATDTNLTGPGGLWFNSPQRFMREEDRLPNFIDFLAHPDIGPPVPSSDADFNFPIPMGDSLEIFHTDRAYRHPFLRNTGFHDSTLGIPPIKAFTQQFMRRFRERQHALGTDPQGNLYVPDPRSFYFDTVPILTQPGSVEEITGPASQRFSANFVWIVEQIYASRLLPPAYQNWNYWSHVPVPGDLDGLTLHDRYLADRDAFGLPTQLINGTLEPDLRAFGARLPDGTPRSGADRGNRRIMTWWAQVCQHAADQVMKHTFYDVVHNGFGDVAAWPDVQIVNYHTTLQDGRLHPCGAVEDSICTYTDDDDSCWQDDVAYRNSLGEPNPSSTLPVQFMPASGRRLDIDSVAFWHINPAQRPTPESGWVSERRWGSVTQTSFSNTDSPLMYPLFDDRTFVRQHNLYARKTPDGLNLLETRYESAFRLKRHELETADGARRTGPNVRPVVPFVFMAGLILSDPDQPRVAFSVYELVQDLALVRSKRVQNVFFFNSLRSYANPNTDSVNSWIRSEQALRGVYAPRVRSVTYTTRDNSNPQVTSQDPAVLDLIDDTLAAADNSPRVLDVQSRLEPGTTQSRATLWVSFADRLAGGDPPTEAPNLLRLVNAGADFLIRLECSTHLASSNAPDPNVQLEVRCQRTDGLWTTLASFDGEGQVSTARNIFAITRCTWLAANSGAAVGEPPLDPSTITLVASAVGQDPAHAFHVEVDLLQVVPYFAHASTLEPALCVPPFTFGVQAGTPNSRTNPVYAGTSRFTPQAGPNAFRVTWEKPVLADVRPGGTSDHFVRLYRATGPGPNDFEDLTCRTHQSLTGANESVLVQYVPNPSVPTDRALPPGLYNVCTFDRVATAPSPCNGSIYPTLRTHFLTDTPSLEGDPPVAMQEFWVRVFDDSPRVSSIPPRPDMAPCNRDLTSCPADVDDGRGLGIPDRGVTVDDLLYYLNIYAQGLPCADLDNGTATGTPDGGVTIDDLLYYLQRYQLGC